MPKTETKAKDETAVATEAPPAQLPAIANPPSQVPAQREDKPLPQTPSMPQTGFAHLAAAIAMTMSEIGEERVVKRGKNTFHNYKYASMQDILQSLTPLMSKHGIVVMQTEVERGFMDNGNAVYATYDFTVMHKSGEVWPFPQRQTGVSNTRTSKGSFDDKSINKCHTAARKYFLLALFQIPTEDETDADRGDNDGSPRQHKPRQPAERATPPEEQAAATKVAPHEIPRPAGIKAVEWARQYVEQLQLCTTVEEIMEWQKLNATSLNELLEKARGIYDRIKSVQDDKIAELGAAQQQ